MQCDELVAEGAIAERTPAELVSKCDITFAMLSDPAAALQVGICSHQRLEAPMLLLQAESNRHHPVMICTSHNKQQPSLHQKLLKTTPIMVGGRLQWDTPTPGCLRCQNARCCLHLLLQSVFPAADNVWLPCWPLQAALGEQGAVAGVSAGKGYVDMSTVDEATSKQIAAAVAAKGGRFLEVGGWMLRVDSGMQLCRKHSCCATCTDNMQQLPIRRCFVCLLAAPKARSTMWSLLLPMSLTLVALLFGPLLLPAAPAGSRVWQQEARH